MTDRVTPQIAKIYGLPSARGAIVSTIDKTVTVNGVMVESPAAKAGLKLNDVIVELRGERIKDDEDLVRRVASTPVGTTAPVKIYRDKKEMTLSVVVGRRPGREISNAKTAAPSKTSNGDLRKESIGISFGNLTSMQADGNDIEVTQGVLVVRVEPGSVAEDAELRVNDVIEAINRETVRDKEDFKRVLSRLDSGAAIVLQVYRKSRANPHIFISFNKP
jgi:S1-C subfamily serine protease